LKSTFKFLAFIVLMILANIRLEATTYLVSTIQEFNTAVLAAVPGDSIVLKKGNWVDVRLIFRGNGTVDNPITLTVEQPGRTFITGNSNLRIYGNYLIVDGLYFKDGKSPTGSIIEFRNGSAETSNYSRLTNSAIVNFNPPSTTTDYKWVSLYGSNNRVDHCYFAGKNHSGTLLVVWMDSSPDFHTIDHNYFGYRPVYGANGAETIRIGTSDWSMYNSNCVVEYNYFEECDGEIEAISNKSCENIYRYNTFYRTAGTLTLRHGNRCEVYENFFFGDNKASTGGVRIIGEDHKVFNNYFADLKGAGYWSALSMVNGVPNSPLNRYFQVKNALVAFNTFVNNTSNFDIGTGKSDEQSLPPMDCVIANNLVQSQSAPIINYTDQPVNLFYEGNIMFGANLGIPQPSGITMVDPELEFAADTVWRITQNSTAKDSSVGVYDLVTDDFDGQLRDSLKDIGCDELSVESIIRIRADASNTGASFLNFIQNGGNIIKVGAGLDSLFNAIQNAEQYDIFELITSGGQYENSSTIIINDEIEIRGADGLDLQPVISNINSNPDESVFEITSNGSLSLSNIELTGGSGSNNPKSTIIKTQQLPLDQFYFTAEDCYFRDVDGNFVYASPFSFADSITFRKCLFTGSNGIGIKMDDEDANSGRYNTKKLVIENSTFWKLNKEAVSVYGGDTLETTPGPLIYINHCTFDSIGLTGTRMLSFSEAHNTSIKNSIFSNSNNSNESILISGANSQISFSDTFNVGVFVLERNSTAIYVILGFDPLYLPGPSGYYMLANNSPLLGKASDWRAMGDLRWEPNFTYIKDENPDVIQSFALKQNFPNPFNPITQIEFNLKSDGDLTLKIYDLTGALVNIIADGYYKSGVHTVTFRAKDMPSSIYFYRLQQGNNYITKKMILLK
jgi:poly(beta-D-mannuronate) lyase